jgi:hypothetical protein
MFSWCGSLDGISLKPELDQYLDQWHHTGEILVISVLFLQFRGAFGVTLRVVLLPFGRLLLQLDEIQLVEME